MTNEKQYRIAKATLGAFLNAWCEIDEVNYLEHVDEYTERFNCHQCEFRTDTHKCLVKVFINSDKFAKDEWRVIKGQLSMEVE